MAELAIDFNEIDLASRREHAPGAGALVELEDIDSGDIVCYRIVGPDETDARRGWISIDAPLARAMLKKRVDDEFEVQLPGGKVLHAIIGIRYPAS